MKSNKKSEKCFREVTKKFKKWLTIGCIWRLSLAPPGIFNCIWVITQFSFIFLTHLMAWFFFNWIAMPNLRKGWFALIAMTFHNQIILIDQSFIKCQIYQQRFINSRKDTYSTTIAEKWNVRKRRLYNTTKKHDLSVKKIKTGIFKFSLRRLLPISEFFHKVWVELFVLFRFKRGSLKIKHIEHLYFKS